MFLKYNISNIKPERRLLEIAHITVLSETPEFAQFLLKTSNPHKLSVNDEVFLTRDVMVGESLTTTTAKCKILDNDFTPTQFVIEVQRYKPICIKDVIDGEEISVAHTVNTIPLKLLKGDIFNIKPRIWSYELIFVEDENDISFITVKNIPNEYCGYEYLKNEYTGQLYQWNFHYNDDIECTFLNDKYFQAAVGVVNTDDEYVVEDNAFVTSEGTLQDDVSFYEYKENINIQLAITASNNTELNDEESAHYLFNEKKQALIPDISDYEKRCFSPYYKSGNKFYPAEEIRFNLFLRDRSGSDNWTSNDAMGWNQFILSGDTFVRSSKITEGDLMGYLNFTDEDIYYRKQKVSKSFLRLSFYDSTDPMNQMLLFYSTVFLDANKLYGNYIKNLSQKDINDKTPIVNDNSFENDNLTLTFNVYDRYNRMASSEGFYLYLFPDGIKDGVERTIYMKAEFNHAGYGTTIPLIYPNNGAIAYSFENDSFPTSLIDDEDGNLKEFYRQLYIPLRIKYDASVDDYIYYFVLANYNNKNVVTMNLYEPKINPIGETSIDTDIDSTPTYELAISPREVTLDVGSSMQVNAYYKTLKDGKVVNSLDVTKTVSWDIRNVNIATISNSGMVNAKNSGSGFIDASYKGCTDSIRLTVNGYVPKYFNIYVDEKGNITQNSDVSSLPCDVTITVSWWANILWDDNQDGDDDRQEQTSGTTEQTFRAGSTTLIRYADISGGNGINSWIGESEITGPTNVNFTYNKDYYKITWL